MAGAVGCSCSSFQFNDANYDYTNTNSTGSSQLSLKIYGRAGLASWQKMILTRGPWYRKGSGPQIQQRMKRVAHLYQQIYDIQNLQLADKNASKGKHGQYGVQQHLKSQEQNLHQLQAMLINRTYRTSQYTTFKIYEPKEREIFRLPYFPDRICHHAIMNIVGPIWTATFTADTYSCILNRGIHGAAKAIKHALQDHVGTQYCLKLDIRKFYPSIDHDILKNIIRRKIKDQDLLWLLDEIIDSSPGLPIGNYLSQTLANLYLTRFDHWLKECKGVKYYFRYCDDLVILGRNKEDLHQLLAEITDYLGDHLRLQVKQNYQVFPVAARGIDFVGYKFFHSHILLRKSIKKAFARKMAKHQNLKSFAAYYGWAVHCNSGNLLKKLINENVRRSRHQAVKQKFYRGQDQNRAVTQSGDRGA